MPERKAPIADVLAACQAAYEKLQEPRTQGEDWRARATLEGAYPRLRAELERLQQEIDRINTPETHHFVEAAEREAAHQRLRWNAAHDGGKTDADWFWLIGYLAGKALHNPEGDIEKRLHRIVTVAAAAANWHAATLGQTDMRPGIEPPGDPNG